jgi:hypothetical protein
MTRIGVPQTKDSFWTWLLDAGNRLGRFVEEHRDEIEALGIWGTVNAACEDAHLYAPFDPNAWTEISTEVRRQRLEGATVDAGPTILAVYGRGGAGFDALVDELSTSSALADRRRETQEVIDSVVDERHYVATCGALPLVEYVLTHSAGRWKQAPDLVKLLRQRLHDENPAFDDGLVLSYAAVEMVFNEIPEIWKDGRHPSGAMIKRLNRHLVLHGTGVGWDDAQNATRAVLLLAATARTVSVLYDSP